MTDSKALARRVQILEDIEAVKRTMYRYWRCLDDKLGDDELRECFTEDVVADYGVLGGANGRDELIRFLTPERDRSIELSHGGHNEEVDIVDEKTAHARFKLHDWVTITGRTIMRGFGRYDMVFAKEGDTWRIERLKLHYQYRETHGLFVNNEDVGFGEVDRLFAQNG